MPNAVMIGAGKIGRGFLAHAMLRSGYHIVFIDKDDALIAALRAHESYPVRIVGARGAATELVEGYEALHVSQRQEIAQAVRSAVLVAVSVGVNNLSGVAEYLAQALETRLDGEPLNVMACENMIGADIALRDAVFTEWTEQTRERAEKSIAFVPVCIGKTAPLPPADLIKEHPLFVLVDDYEELPIDARAIKGALPPLYGAKLYEDFSYAIRRKLFIHNMGHAVAAYVGALRGHDLLADAMTDAAVYALARGAMREAAQGISAAYPFAEGLDAYIEGLLALFANPDMGDTLARIGRDPLRKTAKDDRLAGAYRFCWEQGLRPTCIPAGLAAALCFAPHDDSAAVTMRERIAKQGLMAFLREHCGLDEGMAHGVLCALEALMLAL